MAESMSEFREIVSRMFDSEDKLQTDLPNWDHNVKKMEGGGVHLQKKI